MNFINFSRFLKDSDSSLSTSFAASKVANIIEITNSLIRNSHLSICNISNIISNIGLPYLTKRQDMPIIIHTQFIANKLRMARNTYYEISMLVIRFNNRIGRSVLLQFIPPLFSCEALQFFCQYLLSSQQACPTLAYILRVSPSSLLEYRQPRLTRDFL